MALSIGELVGYVDLDTGAAETSANGLTKVFDTVGKTWGKLFDAAGKRAGDAAGAGLEQGVQQGLAGTGSEFAAAGDKAADEFGDSLESKVTTVAKAGAVAAAAAFSASLVGAINLEPSRDRVAAALDLTAEQAARAGKVSGGLYAAAWGESAEEVDAAVEAVMSSIKGMRDASESELRGVTEAALTLATTMQVDVVRAAQVAGNMVANGMAKNGTQAMDLLGKALSKVPVQLREDVMDAADEYGQFFNQLGIKGPQAMGMLAAGAEKGMYGIDKAGDAVKEFTIRATDGSKATATAIESIGLPFHKIENQLLAGGDKAHSAFNKIVTGLLDIDDPAARAQTALTLFGTPLEDLGTKDIPAFLQSLRDGAVGMDDWRGTTDRMGSTLNDNARTNLTEFTRSIKSGFIDMLGGKVLPVVTDMTSKLNDGLGPAFDFIGKAISTATGFLSEHKAVAMTLAGIITALAVVTGTHAAVMAVAAAGGMASWLLQTNLISAATRVWTAVQWAMNAALAANPITLVVLALVALVAAIALAWTKSEKFREVVTGAFNAVKDAITGAASTVLGFLRSKWPLILAILTGPIGLAVLAIAKHWDTIKSGASGVVEWIKGIPGKIGALGGRFGDAGRDLLQGFIDGMKNAAGIITGIAGNVWDAVKGLLNGAIGKINAALDFKISLPGPDLHVNIPDIPQLATGGRATKATLAVFGEGDEAETVLPDSMLRGLLERVHAAGAASAADTGRGAPLIGQVVQRDGESVDELAERLWFKTRTRG